MTRTASFASHLPLLGFTWTLLLGSGLALGAALPHPTLPPKALCGAALFLTGAGGLMSFLHLGQKTRAPFVLRGVAHSWLSREAVVAGIFGACLGLVLLLGPRWAPCAGASGLALALCIALLYRLEAHPRWAALSTIAAPILSVLLLATLIWEHPTVMAGIGALDLGAAFLRSIQAQRPDPGALPAFPQLSGLSRWARRVRLVLACGAMALGASGWPLLAIALQALVLGLDRFDLYADACVRSPQAGLQRIKMQRMSASLADDPALKSSKPISDAPRTLLSVPRWRKFPSRP